MNRYLSRPKRLKLIWDFKACRAAPQHPRLGEVLDEYGVFDCPHPDSVLGDHLTYDRWRQRERVADIAALKRANHAKFKCHLGNFVILLLKFIPPWRWVVRWHPLFMLVEDTRE
jgi:hypothetical protein